MFSIDRFEGGYAVCEEEGTEFFIKADLLPEEAKEGDLIEESCGRFTLCQEETEAARKENHDLLSALFK